MDSFHADGFEYIDNLNFALNAETYLEGNSSRDQYISKAKEIFRRIGWHGDGEIQLIWLPPFLFGSYGLTRGVVLWHVKQVEDGISWILSPIEMPHGVIKLSDAEKLRIEKLHGRDKVG